MTNDAELLRRFVAESSDAAFRELVSGRIDFVYAAALRQVGGDAHLAQEVVQSVFLDLARKARALASRQSLAGWLYTSTRFAAAKALRARICRLNHETEAQAMHEILAAHSPTEINWNELRPVIDAALHEMSEADREAILLRYFDGRPLAEVGVALGLAENSARMRVERALEKLRARLARRGINSTAAALGVALIGQQGISAPAGLGATVAGTSLAGAAAAGGGVTLALALLEFMNTTKLALGAVGAIVALGLGGYFGMQYQAHRPAEPEAARIGAEKATLAVLREEQRRLKDELIQQRAARAALSVMREADAGAGRETPATPPPGQWRVLADLQQKKYVDPRITFVTPTGKLDDAFASLFELTPAERPALQQALDKASGDLAEFERQNATVSRDDRGGVKIAVKPFAAAGGAVYDELMKAFAQTLGPERNSAFLALGADQVEKALARFGAVDRTVTFNFSSGLRGDKGAYDVLEEIRVGTQEHSKLIHQYRDFPDVVDHVGTIARLVPPEFTRGKLGGP